MCTLTPTHAISPTNLHSSLVCGRGSGLCQVVHVVADLAISGVVVCPQWRQHGEALLLGSLTFGVTQHVLVQSVWVATLEIQAERDVTV